MSDDHKTDLAPEAAAPRPIVYVRAVEKEDLPNPEQIPSKGPFYALHDEEGRALAVFDDRATAFVVARSNNMTPVSAH